MKLKIIIDGASEQELQQGHDAAMAVLNAAGVTPLQAAKASFKQESESDDPPELTAWERDAAHAWNSAAYAAAEAACAGWPKPVQAADFELVDWPGQ